MSCRMVFAIKASLHNNIMNYVIVTGAKELELPSHTVKDEY